MKNSKIEWTDHTWNPWRGCTKVSPGCANCYAETLSKRNPAVFGEWGRGKPRVLAKNWREPVKWNRIREVAWAEERDAGLKIYQSRVFPSLCDWLDEEVPVEWLARFLALIHGTPNLDWLLLTKRPENFFPSMEHAACQLGVAAERGCKESSDIWGMVFDWIKGTPPPNVWVGVSVEDQARAGQRIPELLKIPARVRFLSIEPLLGPVKLDHIDAEEAGHREFCQIDALTGRHTDMGRPCNPVEKVDWVIVGGESGPGARPCRIDWIRDIVSQCKAARLPCFVKQIGARPVDRNDRGFEGDSGICGWPMDTDIEDDVEPGTFQGKLVRIRTKHPKGGDPSEWPEDIRVRKMPEVES